MKLWKYWRLALITTSALAISAKAAFAMPAAIGILGSLATSVAAGATASQVAMGLFVSAISYGVQTLLGNMLKQDIKPKRVKEKIESGGDNPLSFILGEYCTAGKLVYVNESEGNAYLTMVISLSELPVTSFSDAIFINGDRCQIDTSGGSFLESDAPSPGFYRVVEYDKLDDDDYKHQYCWIKFHDGTQTAADPYLTNTFGSDPDKPWTSNMVGRGCAYAIVVCRYSSKGVWSGVPEFKFVIRGCKLYDPRKDSSVGGSGSQRWNDQSTWAFSENPKVMIYNILRGLSFNGDWLWGGQNVSAYRLPLSYWFAAMNHCDEDVNLSAGGTQKRYTAACEIHVDQQPIDVIKELDKTCAGYTTEYGGKWKTWAGPPGSSVLSFTDKDIVITEEQSDSLFRPVQEIYNGARATYVNQNAGWVMKDAPPRIFDGSAGSDDLVAADGGYSLIADLQFPYVTNSQQCQRLMRLLILDSRRQITHTMTLPPSAYIDEPFDVNNWSSDRNGYVNKKFQVTSIDDQPNCNQLIAIRETDPSDYDWDTTFELPDTVGDLSPIRPAQLALDFTVSPDQVDRPGGGKDKPAILIEWTWGAPDLDLAYVKWECRRAGQTKVIAHGIFHNMEDNSRTVTSAAFRFKNDYEVRLFAQPDRKGRLSSWTAWKSVSLYDIDVPGAPTLTAVSDLADDGTLDFFLKIDWTSIAAEVQYTVRVVSGGDTRYYYVDESHIKIPVTSGKSYTVDVRAVAQDGGTKGDWSSTTSITITKKNTAPTAPSSLTLTADFHKLILAWNDSPDNDFSKVNIYRSNTNDFTTASLVHSTKAAGWTNDGLGNLVTRYYWITFVDRSGNESAKYPVSNTGGVSGTTTAITDTDTDGTGPSPPTGLTVTQLIGLNGDGKAEIEFEVSFTGIANKKATYVIRVENVSASRFTYYDVKDIGTGVATPHTKTFPVISGTNYNVSVASVSGTGVVGSYTSNVNVTASKKSAIPGAPTSFSITPKAKGFKFNWTQPSDTDIKNFECYVNTANNQTGGIGVVKVGNGDHFLYGDELTVGTAYYVFIRSRDRSDNVSAWVAASNNPQTYRSARAADITPVDTSNMVRDPDMSDVSLWNGTTAITQTATALVVASQNRLSLAASTALLQIYSDADIAVEVGKTYFASGYGGPTNGVSATYSLQAAWFSMDAAGALTYLTNTTADSFTGTAQQKLSGFLTPPANARRAMIALVKNASAGAADITFAEPIFRRAAAGEMIPDGDITEAKTDPTAPATVTSLTLNTVTADIDGDGSIDAALSLAIVNPNTSVGIKRYIIEIQRDSAASPGVYATWKRETVEAEDTADTLTTTYTFKANKNRSHKCRVRPVAFNGKKGAWSALSGAATPTTVSGYNGKTGSSPTVSAIANAVKVSWALTDNGAVALDTTIYKETEILVGGVSLTKVKGTSYTDTTARTPGSNYTYTLKHYDIHGNVTTVSAGTAATWRNASAVAATGDFDTTALAVPGSFTYTQDTNFDLNGDGTVDMVMKVGWAAVTNAVDYEVEISRSTTAGGTYSVVGLGGITNNPTTLEWRHICNVNWFYKARVRARNAYSQPGTWTSLSSAVQPSGKTTAPTDPTNVSVASTVLGVVITSDPSPDLDYAYTEVYTSNLSTPPTSSTPASLAYIIKGVFLAVSSFSFYTWIRHVNTSGVRSNWVSYGAPTLSGMTLLDGIYLTPASIDATRLSSSAVSDKMAAAALNSVGSYAFLLNNSGSGVVAGNTLAAANLAYSSTAAQSGAGTVSGTWRAMGGAPNGAATVFLRIS